MGAIGTVNDPQDMPECNLVGWHQQAIAPEPASATGDDAMVLQVEENLLEELARDALRVGDLRDHHGIVGAGEREECPEAHILPFVRSSIG